MKDNPKRTSNYDEKIGFDVLTDKCEACGNTTTKELHCGECGNNFPYFSPIKPSPEAKEQSADMIEDIKNTIRCAYETNIEELNWTEKFLNEAVNGGYNDIMELMEQYHKEKMREELVKFVEWYDNTFEGYTNPVKVIDEYLNTK